MQQINEKTNEKKFNMVVDKHPDEVYQTINAQGLELGKLGSKAQFYNSRIEYYKSEIENCKS